LVGAETENEVRIRLKYVRTWIDRKTGRVYARLRRRGQPEISLPGSIGSPEFMAGYHAALRGEQPAAAIATARSGQGTINAAIAQYLDSKSFEKRTPSEFTRQRQASTLRKWGGLDSVGTTSLTLLDRKYIDRVISDAPTVGIARTWLITVRPFLQWAVTQQMIDADPTAGILIKLPKSDGHACWTEEQIAQFEARWPIGSRERLLFSLLLYTGQRCSDVRQLGQHSIRDGVFPIKQQKTGAEVFVPVHPELLAAIAECKVVSMRGDTFLATRRGTSIDQRDLNKWFRKACDAAGLPTSCVPHGLRKSFCRRLADLGVPPHQIAALSGHLTLKEVMRYTQAYDRRQAAKAGMAALVAGRAA
jgi:integrase